MTSVQPSAILEPVQSCNRTMVRWLVDDAGHAPANETAKEASTKKAAATKSLRGQIHHSTR
jgi:hypothetical protein